MGVNMRAPFFLTQEAAPELRKNAGCVVNMVDVHGRVPLKDHIVYSAAKAGLIALTRALARELAPEARVNAVAPGAILWPEGDDNEVAHQRIVSNTPLKRTGTPEGRRHHVPDHGCDLHFMCFQWTGDAAFDSQNLALSSEGTLRLNAWTALILAIPSPSGRGSG